MEDRKEKAINLILVGLGLKYFPSIILGMLIQAKTVIPSTLPAIVSLAILGLFVAGYVLFVKGSLLFTRSKGYSQYWGWIGLFSIFGLSILLFIPSRQKVYLENRNSVRDLFAGINIPELLLFLSIALPTIFYSTIWAVSFLIERSFSDLTRDKVIIGIAGIVLIPVFVFILLKQISTANLSLDKIVGSKNSINFKLILSIVALEIPFNYGFSSLTLYNLSFVFPDYVERHLNSRHLSNILEIILYGISSVLLAPVVEELFCRGVVLQKWVSKWGVRAGIITSSLLFAIIHFRYDVISLFIGGAIFSILYFKTCNLITPILCHCFYNSIILIFNIIDFLGKSPVQRNALVTVNDYQNFMEPILGQRVLLLAVSAPLLGYFIFKNFPRNDATLPYLANDGL